MKFKTHSELMSYLLLAEKQQLLLLKNVEARPVKETHTVEMATRKPRGIKAKQNQPRQNQPRQSSSKPKDKSFEKPSSGSAKYDKSKSSRETRSCYNCGRSGHLARDCRIYEYFVKMYQELQRLKARQRETHTLDALALDGVDSKNYMVSRIKPKVYSDVTLLEVKNGEEVLELRQGPRCGSQWLIWIGNF